MKITSDISINNCFHHQQRVCR